MEWISWIDSLMAIIASAITIIVFVYGGWQWIIKPIRQANKLLTENSVKLNKTIDIIDSEILPFIKSMTTEFTKNSGKSIKDQITRIDENIKRSDLRIKLIATNLVTTGIFECDAEGKCVWVNRALADMFGLEREEMLDTGWLSAVVDDERNEVWMDWMYCINNHIPYEAEYSVHNKKRDTTFRIRVVAVATKNEHNRVLGFFGTTIKVQ